MKTMLVFEEHVQNNVQRQYPVCILGWIAACPDWGRLLVFRFRPICVTFLEHVTVASFKIHTCS
jgi:hypothetical protein